LPSGSGSRELPLTLQLLMPTSVCLPLSCQIQHISEVNEALIDVAHVTLPESMDRVVTITGSQEAITEGMTHICDVMCKVRITTLLHLNQSVFASVIIYQNYTE
jgi:hypothetical protein